MKNLRDLTAMLSMVALIIVAGAHDLQATGIDGGAGPAGSPGHGIFASLGLTDEQKAQMKEVLQTYRSAAVPLVQQERAQRHQLRKLIHTAPVDETAIRAQAGQISAVEADLDVLRAQAIQQVLGLLTSDQVRQLTANGGDAAAKIDRFIWRMTRHRPKG